MGWQEERRPACHPYVQMLQAAGFGQELQFANELRLPLTASFPPGPSTGKRCRNVVCWLTLQQLTVQEDQTGG